MIRKKGFTMKKLLLSFNFMFVAVGCGAATSPEAPSFDQPAPIASANNPVKTTNFVAGAVKNEFSVPANAQGLVGGRDTVLRRTGGYRFQSSQVSKPTFVKPALETTGPQLKATAQRFFAALGNTELSDQLKSVPVDTSGPLWQVTTGDSLAIAFAVPQSGAVGLYHKPNWRESTPIHDASEAVTVALGAIADNALLNLADGETLDIIGITGRHMGTTDATSATSIKVGYKVVFGRSFAGIPVYGPTTTVALDSSGKMKAFHRGWREIAGVSGTLAVASDSVIASRRDELAAHFLTEQQVSCGYTEDMHPKAVQDSPGLGCGYHSSDPNATDPLAQNSAEWVSAAEDESVTMHGTLSE